ncbi:MAG: RNA-binding transcriptional accessory protein [Candidatus Tectimicrobiota bacterium]|nr:MAG: RNA-binding transcriptional accessory protein [Candidatus Tectomicrobia bacterium]
MEQGRGGMSTAVAEMEQEAIVARIAAELSLAPPQVARVLELMRGGATVPFLARYRKEATGNLDEDQLFRLLERYRAYQDFLRRRRALLATLAKAGQLTNALQAQLLACYDRAELEDLALPYRPKRHTKASEAAARGLEPLARRLWEEQAGATHPEALAEPFVAPERGVSNVAEALAGAGHLIAEWIAERADVRQALRALLFAEGVVRARVIPAKQGQKTKFQDYYDFHEPVATIPSHRFLAITRGVRQGVLAMSIEVDAAKALRLVEERVLQQPAPALVPYLHRWCADAYHRLLLPALQTEVQRALKERADSEAIAVFQHNLRGLLLAPPLGPHPVIGLAPARRGGYHLAVVDAAGRLLTHATVFPQQEEAAAVQALGELVRRHAVTAVAVGNSPGAREAEAFVRQALQQEGLQQVVCAVVNDAGVAAYAASKLAREELPALEVPVRRAVSIARRLQDPLAELVKVEPSAIGVGQYQHDVDPKRLHRKLVETVVSCVNHVGVDVNTASPQLLQYVAGLSRRHARAIVAYRQQHGRLTNRTQLLAIEGFDARTFQQAAGFLRIRDGDQPLDNTGIHPEAYPTVARMAEALGVTVPALMGNAALLSRLDLRQFVDDAVGLPTLRDICEELRRPGRDPRRPFTSTRRHRGVTPVTELQPGMVLEGIVSNVTNFGAFVDIGLPQDGLVHISELSHRFVRDPRQVVQVGQVVRVQVLGVEPGLQRISLSMKALQRPAMRRRRRRAPAPAPKPAAAPETSLAEKLRALQARFQSADSA